MILGWNAMLFYHEQKKKYETIDLLLFFSFHELVQ